MRQQEKLPQDTSALQICCWRRRKIPSGSQIRQIWICKPWTNSVFIWKHVKVLHRNAIFHMNGEVKVRSFFSELLRFLISSAVWLSRWSKEGRVLDQLILAFSARLDLLAYLWNCFLRHLLISLNTSFDNQTSRDIWPLQ